MNTPEQAFADWAAGEGWDVTKRGWPDFICRRNGELMAVEVKGPTDGLSRQQYDTIRDLRAAGIPVFVWGPDTGFVEVGGPTGESVHSLRATIADLQRLVAQLTSLPNDEPASEVIQWTYNEHEPRTLEQLSRECRRSHSEHLTWSIGSHAYCAEVVIMSKRLPLEEIAELAGTDVSHIERTIAHAAEFMRRRQHADMHNALGRGHRCTGCESEAA